MTHHGVGELPGAAHYCTPSSDGEDQPSNRFGRMFPKLPPNYTPADLLVDIGKVAGPMDGGADPDRTQTVPVGHVIFGQFIDHDITLDVTSSLDRVADSGNPNVRTPTLDLDCVYGEGPEASRFMHADDGAHLLTGADEPAADEAESLKKRNDLLRGPTGRAIIGDFRNDENRIVSQMQLAMIKYHNQVCDQLQSTYSGSELYEHAREHVTWHYQWCVVHDFLAAMCGARVVQDILSNGRKVYCHVTDPYIPVEFAVAAYRFGHSMVPQKIQVQKGGKSFPFFNKNKGEATGLGQGFEPINGVHAIVDWHELFDTSAGRVVQRSEKLDTKMAAILLDLPFIGSPDETSLATRNLLRANQFRLPSGEQVAQLMIEREVDDLDQSKVDPVTANVRDMADSVGSTALEHGGSPLWLYILSEAEVIGRADGVGGNDPGEGLGPVGARIVAEVLIGLLELDERSYLGANRNWVPEPGESSIGEILASTNSADL